MVRKNLLYYLRWIGIVGQLIAVNFVYFYLNFTFDFVSSNLVIFLGILSNFYLIFIYKKTQLSDRSAFLFLFIDIIQLTILIYLTGGIVNPFVIFLIIPSVLSSSNLSFKINTILVILTIIIIIFLTFFSKELPSPISDHFHVTLFLFYSNRINHCSCILNYFVRHLVQSHYVKKL